MRRRNRPKNSKKDDSEEFNVDRLLGIQRSENWSDGDWVVRRVTGSAATKPYRCPGCDQVIPMATPHTVAWLENDQTGRRHWHNICWSKRNLRKPKVERTRSAPRY